MLPGKDHNSYDTRQSWQNARIEGKQSDGYGASEQNELGSPACSLAPAVRTKPACLCRESPTARVESKLASAQSSAWAYWGKRHIERCSRIKSSS